MSRKNYISQLVIWLKRFRQRKGYGVHSPFAFNFITHIIFEKGYYYNYSNFSNLPKDKVESKKLCKLLFRLVNFTQPKTIYYQTNSPSIAAIFTWAKSDVKIATQLTSKTDLIYIGPNKRGLITEDTQTIYEQLGKNSILIIYGIGYNVETKLFWQSLIKHEKAGISFDLHDCGILFFDQEKNKQDYIVNFEF